MHTFENQTISDDQCPATLGPKERLHKFRVVRNVMLEDLDFIKCDFLGPGLATYGAPVHRSTARNIRITSCRSNGFVGIGAVFDEVTVNGLTTSRMPAILDGCAFRHATLRGNLGRFLVNRNVCHDDDDRNEAFHAANAAFYESVDWALDITEAKASCIEIRGAIPTHLIRRNPEEHFIMTRKAAQSEVWRNYEPFDAFQISIHSFLESKAGQNLFVAARRSPHFKEQLSYYHGLRDAGIVS